jgi:hypothetical protein
LTAIAWIVRAHRLDRAGPSLECPSLDSGTARVRWNRSTRSAALGPTVLASATAKRMPDEVTFAIRPRCHDDIRAHRLWRARASGACGHRRESSQPHGAEPGQGLGDRRHRQWPPRVCAGVRRTQRQGRPADGRHGDVWRVPDQTGVRLHGHAIGGARPDRPGQAHRRRPAQASAGVWRRRNRAALCRLVRAGCAVAETDASSNRTAN